MAVNEQEVFAGTRDSVIKGCFRDTADRDYIAARLLHRQQLWEQFLWMGLQAIEKYLKAIILFDDGDTRNLRHDITEALKKAEKIERLGMRVSPRAREFIKYLEEQGKNRYFTRPRYIKGKELLHLDHTVWQVRRFCDDFFFPWDLPILLERQSTRLKEVQAGRDKKWATFRLDKQGFLEMVLDGGKHPDLRSALVWKNFYYGGRNRNRIYARLGEHWTLPNNLVHPEILEWARTRMTLSGPVIAEMERRLKERQRSGK